MALRALVAVALALPGAGCSERKPAPEPEVPAEVGAEVAERWWTASPPCPDGAELRGAPPPQATAIWCEAGGAKHGPYSAWREVDGALVEERRGAYARGAEHGVWLTFSATGARAVVAGYREGALHGRYREYGAADAVRLEGGYDGGAPHGRWTAYGAGGEVLATWVMERGTGTMQRFHPSGARAVEYGMRGGAIDGTWTTWDERGVKTGETTYVRGRRQGRSVRWKDGVVIEEGTYRDDMKSGVWRERGVERRYDRGQVVNGG